MRAVIQRVKNASVTVERELIASIGPGLLVLLGIEPADTAADGEWLAQKIATLRIFADDTGAWSRSVADIAGEILLVSQFTLFASTKRGTKPSWHRAAPPDIAAPMCATFTEQLAALLPGRVKSGRFGAMMDVALINDGPVTLLIDTRERE